MQAQRSASDVVLVPMRREMAEAALAARTAAAQRNTEGEVLSAIKDALDDQPTFDEAAVARIADEEDFTTQTVMELASRLWPLFVNDVRGRLLSEEVKYIARRAFDGESRKHREVPGPMGAALRAVADAVFSSGGNHA